MPNDRLRSALLERGITPADLASAMQVDPKSVQRWIGGRLPYRRHRYAIAAYLKLDEAYLWPEALSPDQVANASESEIINIYPHRWTVPAELWRTFFENAESEIGVLVYSGLFLAEDAGVQRILRKKAEGGAKVRILLGDPEAEEVAQRGVDEGIGDTMAAKIRNAMVLYKPLQRIKPIEFRLHRTVLYNSIYRADDQLLVNTHIYNFPASAAPVLHLRGVAGGDMVTTYMESFDRVWDDATPWELR
jgi:transcriptional regulator with XRE-family HTH domain